jgi:hypothetical protein
MQTGTALFFGLSLVAIVILYHSTKDRWNWKKIAKKILIVYQNPGVAEFTLTNKDIHKIDLQIYNEDFNYIKFNNINK